MFQSFASYFLGGTDTTGGVDNGDDNNTRVDLRTTEHEDGWTLVDRESDGDSDRYSSEEEDNVTGDGLERVRLGRASSSESLNSGGHNTNRTSAMDESWFVTPPPCFSSQTGPVQLVTSPLENLLIEHPSMSVYVRNGSRHPLIRTPSPSDIADEEEDDDVEEEIELEPMILPPELLYLEHVLIRRPNQRYNADWLRRLVHTAGEPTAPAEQVGVPTPSAAAASHRCHRAQPVPLGPGQLAKNRQAQKMQVKKLAKQATRGHLDRSNKAREVNGRNRNPRRKERCQGSARSHANNNRKC
ncbi:tumor protein p53-inducible nuclear protein 1 [Sitophilus oryzae]|uniref:Tumor protein p53-inducible nuclear protein 1 n=1 Tax=Sitophilus oryzae TaxID=7048 RepID=A0A6J2XHI8_SITOR|nr:tumor protein p53-inducible nuclear protein 1 [Sitophilus oryzae]XP_030750391.1 tumor protein p53-inducible nuclear protein 1 [Sitophilus oryzae]